MIGVEDLLTHSCSQKMKCVIVDCLKNQKASVLFDDSTFLLYMFQSNQANLNLFNPQFTAITQSLKIHEIDSTSCSAWIRKENKFFFIHTCKNKVIANKFELKDGQYVHLNEEYFVQYKFEDKDGFRFLSQSFRLNQREQQAIVAYSKNNQFYFILCSFKDKRMQLSVSKLSDLDRPNGIMSWFIKQKPTHYENVKILPLFANEIDRLRVLCLRDNTAGIFQICYNNSKVVSIKQAYSCKTFSKAVKDKDTFLSAQLLSASSVLLAYSASSKLTLVKLSIEDHQNCITYEAFPTNISSNNLKMHICNQNIYINVKSSSSKYQCYKSSLTKLQELTGKEIEPMIERKDLLWLAGNTKELFLINSHNIYVLEELHHFRGDISDEQRRYQSYQNWVDRTFNKKIKKFVQQSLYHQVQHISAQKEENLVEQFNHLKKRNVENQQIIDKLSQKIICAAIIKTALSKKTSLRNFLQQLKEEKPQINDLIEQDFLDLVIINETPQMIRRLMKVIVRMSMYDYLNEVLQQISKHQHRQDCQKTINDIFSQVCQQAILSLHKKKEGDKYQLKMLLQFTFRFISVKQGKFVDTFLQLANNEEHHQFVQNIVLNHKLIKIFMHLFISSSIPFTSNDVLEIVGFLQEKDVKHKYLSQFFFRIRQAYTINKSNKQLIHKVTLLMKGLQPFFEQIGGIVDKNFPGISVFLLINNKNRKHFRSQINQIANKCSLPFTSYMLALSNFDKTKSSLQTLAKIRLYEEIQQPYSQSQDILASIQSGKYDKKSIRGQIWQKSLQTLEVGKLQAQILAKKIKII